MCLKERGSQKSNTQNLNFKEENTSRFYSWGLERVVVLKVCSIEFFLPPLLGDDGDVVVVGLLILSYQSHCWQAWYGMGQGVIDLCRTCLETCLELPKISLLDFLYCDLMDQFEGSRRLDEHQWKNSVARESSRVIILKSRLNSTGYSACTSEVRDIFDRHTHVPTDWWQLICSRVLQPWGRRNSTTAPVRNITNI